MIPVNKGKFQTAVDDEDYDLLSRETWYLDSSGYVVASIGFHRVTTRMSRFLMNTPKGVECDHIYGDKLDHQRRNLRNCSVRENRRNRGLFKNNKTGYKGVSRDQFNKGKPYKAQRKIDNKVIYLGNHATAEEAARAYDMAARQEHGEFARLNFPEGGGR